MSDSILPVLNTKIVKLFYIFLNSTMEGSSIDISLILSFSFDYKKVKPFKYNQNLYLNVWINIFGLILKLKLGNYKSFVKLAIKISQHNKCNESKAFPKTVWISM